MKIAFDDNSYLEVLVSSKDKIQIILSARNGKDPKNNIVNSAEISQQQFLAIVQEINGILDNNCVE